MLTAKQGIILRYLETNQNRWVSPTEVGEYYGEVMGIKGYHSAQASPTLLRLVHLRKAKRNGKGHYKFKKD